MTHLIQKAIFLAMFSLYSCGADGTPRGKAPLAESHTTHVKAPAESLHASSFRLVTRERAGRALEILDARGTLIATFLPEDFTQRLLVPDIANNSNELITLSVAGTDILTASLEPNSHQVLVGVRGFLYAEVSTDLVFVLTLGSGENKKASAKLLPVYLDGPQATEEGRAARPHFDISRVSFGTAGTIELEIADASGGTGKLVYDASRVPVSCTWQGGESPRCPKGVLPK